MVGQVADAIVAIRARKLLASPAERVGRGAWCLDERYLSWCWQVSPMGVFIGRVRHAGQCSPHVEKFLPRLRNASPMGALLGSVKLAGQYGPQGERP